MLSRFKLIHTLILGFGLLGLLILYITNLGHSSTAQLKETLDYIAGDAWDTADGAMEGTIGIELQMLSIEQYLADANNKEALENLKEGKTLEDEALGRMINAGQMDAKAVAALNQARKEYQQSSELMLKDYDAFTSLEKERRRAYESLLSTLGEIEELGDQFVGQYADTPDKKVTWNSGLKRAWTVADGVMEYRIMILSRGSNYQALLLSKDFDTYMPLFAEPWQEIQTIIDELGVKKKRAIAYALNVRKVSEGEYKGQTFSQALLRATNTHKQTFDAAIESLKELHHAYLDYKAKARKLLSLVEEVEGAADGKVESVTATIQDNYDAITLKMAITLAITMLIALLISVTLIRFILSQTNSAKQLAESITSGNLENEIHSNPKTEFGALMSALDKMQNSLKGSRDQMASSLNKTKRIVDALDNASAKIIITQADGQIVFANKNLNEYFLQNQSSFSGCVKNLGEKDLRDTDIQLFKDLNIPLDHDHLHELSIADKTLEVNIQAIKTDNGETIGFFTEWNDVTDTLAIQKEVKHLITQASKGNLDHRLHTNGLDGFLLELSEGINSMLANIQSAMQDFVDISTKLSNGDFSNSVNTEVEGDLKTLKDALNQAIQNVSSTLNDILSTSQVVRQSANNISSTSSEVSDQASNNAASIEEIAASLEEMTASVQQSAQYTRQVNDSSNKTMLQAESNAKIVDESVSAMESIKEVSIKIDGITNLIDSIAFQTNLLALNAAVEAARAGEHGRGFAVVAGEVRSLAQKSADAAKDIKSLVMEVNEKVGQGSDLVQSSSEGLTTMISEIKSVGEMIAEVSRSSAEQESGISQINSAVTNFDSATQQSAAMVGETATTSQELLKLMVELEQKLQKFKLSTGLSMIKK